jgi:hypothetical protein
MWRESGGVVELISLLARKNAIALGPQVALRPGIGVLRLK